MQKYRLSCIKNIFVDFRLYLAHKQKFDKLEKNGAASTKKVKSGVGRAATLQFAKSQPDINIYYSNFYTIIFDIFCDL